MAYQAISHAQCKENNVNSKGNSRIQLYKTDDSLNFSLNITISLNQPLSRSGDANRPSPTVLISQLYFRLYLFYKASFSMQFWLTMLWFDILMKEGNKIIIIESFVSISREHVLSKLKARLWQIQTTFALYLPNQRNRTVLGKGLLYTETWGPARDGSQPIRIHDFTWSSYWGKTLDKIRH